MHRLALAWFTQSGQRLFRICVFFCMAGSAALAQNDGNSVPSQTPPAPSSAAPQTEPEVLLKTVTHHVIVDVVAKDKHGRPVRDLTQKDFEIFERVGWIGKTPEKIAAFRLVDMTAPQSSSPPGQLVTVPSGAYSNLVAVRDPKTPLTVVLLDELNTNLFDPDIRKQVLDMADSLRQNVTNVPMAVLVLSNNLSMLQDFTTDAGEVRSAIRKLMSSGPYRDYQFTSRDGPSPELQQQFGVAVDPRALPPIRNWDRLSDNNNQELRIQMTLDALRALARHLAGYPGRKKLVWLSAAFPFSILPDPSSDFSMPHSFRDQIAEVTNALSTARVAVYPIQPGGVWMPDVFTAARQARPSNPQGMHAAGGAQGQASAVGRELARQSALQNALTGSMDEVASQTGGASCINANDLGVCLKKALSDGYTYYELGYYPQAENWKPGFHKILIRSKRSGIRLSFRRGYYVPEDRPAAPANASGKIALDPELRRAACDDVMQATGVPLTVFPMVSSKNGDAQYLVEVAPSAVTDVSAPNAGGQLNLQLQFAACTFDANGKRLQYSQFPADYDLDQLKYDKLKREGFRQTFAFRPDPRMKLVRWLVHDPMTGLLGSVDVPWPPPSQPVATALATVPAAQPDAATATEVPLMAAQGKTAARDADSDWGKYTDMPQLKTDKEIASYCGAIAHVNAHAPALVAVCKYALSLSAKLPNLTCVRKTNRFWRNNLSHSHDQVTTSVVYRDGIEYDSDMISAGKRQSRGYRQVGGARTGGEFAATLQAIFSPRSATDFQFQGEKSLISGPALVFAFNIQREDNHLYYLNAIYSNGRVVITFPGYRGTLFIGKSTHQLLSVQRETTEVEPGFPISYASTLIHYSDVALGDGTTFLLPTDADNVTCSPGEGKECAHNLTRYGDYHKFRATTRIVTDAQPSSQPAPAANSGSPASAPESPAEPK